ncbi:MAG: helix-turn-helix transcriptional regulator [Ktedonobacteraceae bacterium]|nr:helix-turn-helix transcriptional regulator [Ktedonobacteraceae bacterium]
MSIRSEERLSESPFVETITRGWTQCDSSTIRPAESSLHLVIVRYQGHAQALVVGACPTSGMISYLEGAELLWIKFRLGTFLPAIPTRTLLDKETPLLEAASHSFWLNGSAWQFPDFENADTFVDQLVRNGVIHRDEIVSAVLQGHQIDAAPRTIRHHFLHTTGLTHTHIQQIGRARQTAELLHQGTSILDAMDTAGYYDQPHLTRALKQWVGHTPAQIIRQGKHE